MPRVKRGFKARRRRNRVLKHAKGFYSARSRIFGDAIEAVHNAWQYQYIHRRLRKRDFRRLWIARINAAARIVGTSYSKLVHGLKQANIGLDRKSLADLAVTHPDVFKTIAQAAGVKAS
jgi:large subunit ribosomal protein L20